MQDREKQIILTAGIAGSIAIALGASGPDDPPQPPQPPANKISPGTRGTGAQFIERLLQYVGKGYTWEKGGTGPYSYDCSGLGWRAANDLGIDIPRVASEQAENSTATDENTARTTPGAVVVFHRRSDDAIRHIEYSTGDGQTTVASQISAGVGRFRWGWWTSPKQSKLWWVSFGILKALQ